MLQSFFNANQIEAGIDEAGRGCYAGPVFAAAVILPASFSHPLLNDSKQLKEQQREELRPLIETQSIAWAVAMVSNEEIDRINILQATYAAMHQCIAQLKKVPTHLLIDGNRFKPYQNIAHTCMVKGDSRFASIAAASILAKTHRDAYMLRLHQEYPQYQWQQNKGYGTATHRDAISRYGLCKYHRKSFNILPAQMELF